MKVQFLGGEHHIRFIIPNGLLFNKLTAFIGFKAIEKYVPELCGSLSAKQINALFAELRRIKAKHGSWPLVDVQSADGEAVKIIL